MELTGKIIAVLDARGGVSARSGNPWKSQEYVIETGGQYSKRCVFNVFGEDRIRQFNIQKGEELTVQFDIDAREYSGKWYNDVRAYNVIRSGSQPSSQPNYSQTPFPEYQQNNDDDLPY